MTKFITQKDQIITQMRAELLATATEEAFLAKLEKADQATDKQTYLAEAIQTVCEQLSSFNNKR